MYFLFILSSLFPIQILSSLSFFVETMDKKKKTPIRWHVFAVIKEQ